MKESLVTFLLKLMSRFLAVVFPVSSISMRTVPITRLAILVTWTLILASNVPVWMAHFTHEIENGIKITTYVLFWLRQELYVCLFICYKVFSRITLSSLFQLS